MHSQGRVGQYVIALTSLQMHSQGRGGQYVIPLTSVQIHFQGRVGQTVKWTHLSTDALSELGRPVGS